MKHLFFTPTPITRLSYYSDLLSCEIECKRDDLFLEAGGGSKARMLQYILADVIPNNIDVFVTAGRPCSNYNRACALMCAQLGIPMHLVEYTDVPEEWNSINYFFCRMAGIRRTRCKKTDVRETIQQVLQQYEREGKHAKYVWGGGKSLEGFFAYYDAVAEIKQQKASVDHLFVACGTGTTLTGICAGMQEHYPNAIVHGISVAHGFEFLWPVLEDNMRQLNCYLGKEFSFANLDLSFDFLCGDYGKYSSELLFEISTCMSREGMIIDPTYSGKAFWGMVETIRENPNMYNGTNVLFLNSGGVFNLISEKNNIMDKFI